MGCVLPWGCNVVKKWCGFAASFEGRRKRRRSDPRNEGAATRATACRAFFARPRAFCATAEEQRRHSFCICFRKCRAGAAQFVRPPRSSDGTAFAFVFANAVPERLNLCDRRVAATAQLLHLFSQMPCRSGSICAAIFFYRRVVMVSVYSGLAGVVLVFLSVF